MECDFEDDFLENSDRSCIEEYLSRLVVGWGKAHLPAPLFLHLPQQYHYTVTGKHVVYDKVVDATKCGNCQAAQKANKKQPRKDCKDCKTETKSKDGKMDAKSKDGKTEKSSWHHHLVQGPDRVVQDVGIVTNTQVTMAIHCEL